MLPSDVKNYNSYDEVDQDPTGVSCQARTDGVHKIDSGSTLASLIHRLCKKIAKRFARRTTNSSVQW